MPRKLTQEEFIAKAREVHGDLYDYSKVIYINSKTKVIIIDHEYGEFLQNPNNHLNGSGNCNRGEISRVKKRRSSTEEFIARARAVHGDLYDYSKVQYIDCMTKVLIVDPIYGSFEQTPDSHLQGKGNVLRALQKKSELQTSSTEEFIIKARAVHGDLYDYSKVKYISATEKVLIIDPEYGTFEQRPSTHLCGHGNPARNLSGFVPSKPAVLYINSISIVQSIYSTVCYKIGIAGTHRLSDRLKKQIKASLGYCTEHMHLWNCSVGLHVQKIEAKIIKKYNLLSNHVLTKEQYKDGYTETFSTELYEQFLADIEDLIAEHNLSCNKGEEILPMALPCAELHELDEVPEKLLYKSTPMQSTRVIRI